MASANIFYLRKQDCVVCDVETGAVSIALAMIRGINLGRRIERASPVLREKFASDCLCSRHCRLLHEHETWANKNTGKDPPWDEEEPS